MQKKLTITIDEKVYQGLHTVIGPRRISRLIEELVSPLVPKFYFGTQLLEKLRFDRQTATKEEDENGAPPCFECGATMVRNGSCYKCLNCGATSGCS